MVKAHITLPDGISLKVDGTPDEIASVVARFQEKAQLKASKEPRGAKRKTGPTHVTGLVAKLIDDGFFKKPKELAAVKAALEAMGHRYPVTTLSPIMLRQVRKQNLRRIKQDQRWMYTE